MSKTCKSGNNSYTNRCRRLGSGFRGWTVVNEFVNMVVLVIPMGFTGTQGHLVHLEHGHLHVQPIGRMSRDRRSPADERPTRFDNMTDQLQKKEAVNVDGADCRLMPPTT